MLQLCVGGWGLTPVMEKSVSGSGWRSITRTVGRYLSCFAMLWNVPEGWIFALCVCYILDSSCLFQKRESNNFKGMSCLPDCDFLCAAPFGHSPGQRKTAGEYRTRWTGHDYHFPFWSSIPLHRETQLQGRNSNTQASGKKMCPSSADLCILNLMAENFTSHWDRKMCFGGGELNVFGVLGNLKNGTRR